MFFLRVAIILALIIGFLLFLSAKGRAYFRLFKNFFHDRPVFIIIPILGLILLITLFFFPPLSSSRPALNFEDQKKHQDSLILHFTEETILDLAKKIQMPIDSQLNLKLIRPELIYILPTCLNVFKSITKKETMPVLFNADSSSLSLKAIGFGVFNNRGFRIKKSLQKKLGNDYIVSFIKPNEILIQYKGYPWNMELKLSLPLLKIAQQEQLDPALLLSLIKNQEGFIPLQKAPDFNRFRERANLLKERLSNFSSMEDALASIYFNVDSPKDLPLKWWKQPLARNWVHQVFIDAQIYREYGFSLE